MYGRSDRWSVMDGVFFWSSKWLLLSQFLLFGRPAWKIDLLPLTSCSGLNYRDIPFSNNVFVDLSSTVFSPFEHSNPVHIFRLTITPFGSWCTKNLIIIQIAKNHQKVHTCTHRYVSLTGKNFHQNSNLCDLCKKNRFVLAIQIWICFVWPQFVYLQDSNTNMISLFLCSVT